jgi:hypothetical protein
VLIRYSWYHFSGFSAGKNARQYHTLPVIEGLAMSDHLKHPKLQQLLSQPVLQRQDAHQVETVLEQMGAIKTCRRLIRAYQVQVEAVFDVLPGLRPYFADYVASKA